MVLLDKNGDREWILLLHFMKQLAARIYRIKWLPYQVITVSSDYRIKWLRYKWLPYQVIKVQVIKVSSD